MIFRILIFLFIAASCGARDFNEAYAASVLSNLEQLIDKPWSRVNNILFSAFNSKWSYLYQGDDVETPSRPDGIVKYVTSNNTRELLWALFKPFEYEESTLINMAYLGFENGMFIGYSTPSPGSLTFMSNGNHSCPKWNITSRCRSVYGGNSTDPVTGEISGESTSAFTYDPRWRPWYTESMTQGGSVWTDPYIYSDEITIGLTAARQIVSNSDQILGVVGTDFTLASIEIELSVIALEDMFIFIVDQFGKMIAASVSGISVDGAKQLYANATNHPLVSNIALHIEKDALVDGGLGGWSHANGTVFSINIDQKGLHWVQVVDLTDEHNLKWHVVIVETASCEYGYYPGEKECLACPSGAECVGGTTYPFPKKGYWFDDCRDMKKAFYSCSWATCKGFRKNAHLLSQTDDNANGDDDDDVFNELLDLCWSSNGLSNNSQCDTDVLQCAEGSQGPMCGSCLEGWRYTASSRRCVQCSERLWLTGFIVCIVILVLGGLITFFRDGFLTIPSQFHSTFGDKIHIPLIGLLSHIDTGVLKVTWSTFQIIQSISFNIQVRFPFPYSILQSWLSFLDLDYLSVICFHGNFLQEVIMISLLPILVAIGCWGIFIFRILYRGIEFGFHSRDMRVLYSQHFYFSLLLIYIVVPTVISKQFKALSCQTLHSGHSFLRVDTSVNCSSKSYRQFLILDCFLILVYQGLCLLYIILLYRVRDKLNPRAANKELALQMRDRDESLHPMQFLFCDYKPNYWYFEITDLYRRIVFISVLPLLSQRNSMKAYMGCTLALFSAIYFRELTPYRVAFTNVIAVIAQYVILLDFMAVLVLDARSLNAFGFSKIGFGCMLIGVNVIIIWLGGYLAYNEYSASARRSQEIQDKAIKIENAVDFTKNKFRTTLEYVIERAVPSSHVLCYYYTSLAEAQESVKLNMIPALVEGNGIVVSLNGPMDIGATHASLHFMGTLAQSWEAVICLSLPRRSLFPVASQPGLTSEMKLFLISSDLLNGMGHFTPPKRRHSSKRKSYYAPTRLDGSRHSNETTSFDILKSKFLFEAFSDNDKDHHDKHFQSIVHKVEASTNSGGGTSKSSSGHSSDLSSSFNRFINDEYQMTPGISNGSRRSSLDTNASMKSIDLHTLDEGETKQHQNVTTLYDLSPLPEKRKGSLRPLTSSSKHSVNSKKVMPMSPNVSPVTTPVTTPVIPHKGEGGPSPITNLMSNTSTSHILNLNFECAVRAYQLKNTVECNASAHESSDYMLEDTREYDPNVMEFNKPKTLLEYTEIMNEIRIDCIKDETVPLYHYTNAAAAPFIFERGFRMSTQGQGDGGVYFSTLGPASYGLGTDEYEKNIIIDCFGKERLEELRDKHKFDVVFVYAVNPKLIEPAPGGRDHAHMVSKQLFQTFGTKSYGGQYFLRPDFIVGAFLFDRVFNHRVIHQQKMKEAKHALEEEKKHDLEILNKIQISEKKITEISQNLEKVMRMKKKLKPTLSRKTSLFSLGVPVGPTHAVKSFEQDRTSFRFSGGNGRPKISPKVSPTFSKAMFFRSGSTTK